MEYEFPLEGRDLSEVTEAEVLSAAETGKCITTVGRRVARITSTAVVKIGLGVFQQEAWNMQYVFDHSAGRIRVPKVHRYFVSGDMGYLVMEYIDGECLDKMPWSARTTQQRQSIIFQAAEGLRCIGSLQSEHPGPVGQGIPQGGMFTLYGACRSFESASDLEPWFNHKLAFWNEGEVTGKLKDLDLVMRHLDIAMRNFILDKAGKLWFLDWAWAGFFPRIFEQTRLKYRFPENPEFQFTQELLREVNFDCPDESLLKLLLRVCALNDGPFMGSHVVQASQP